MAFLHMGKYAQYVWPAYGIVLAVFLLNVLWAQRLLGRARAEARRRIAIQEETP